MTSTTANKAGCRDAFGATVGAVVRGFWLAAAVCFGGGSGCGSGTAPVEADEDRVVLTYICTETGTVERGPQRVWPYLNPATGRESFVLHLYSPQAQRWVPVPPPKVVGGNPLAMRCPKTGGPLSTEGPEPSSRTVQKSTGQKATGQPAGRVTVGK
jgi:hypothetical protein